MSDIPLSWLQRPLFYSGPVVLHYFYSSFLWTLDKDKNANNVSYVIPANTCSFRATAWPVFTLLCVEMALWVHSRCGDLIVPPVFFLYCCWCYNIAQCFVQQYNRSSHNGSCDWGGAVFLCPKSGVFNLELFPVQWGSLCFVTVVSRYQKYILSSYEPKVRAQTWGPLNWGSVRNTHQLLAPHGSRIM